MTSTPLYPLCNIILPSEAGYENLFIREIDNKLYFNTWMNMLAAKKYGYYCELGNIYLQLNIEGKYRLEIIGSNRDENQTVTDAVLVSKEVEGDICERVPMAKEYEGIYFCIIQDPEAPVLLKGGMWCTDVAAPRQNKIAIVSCTYKREEYIKKNIELFESFIKNTPSVRGRLKFNIVDNGQTLPDSIKSDNVDLFYNMNSGGAGGFTRGLIEVMKKQEGFTHVLFMDDDVEIITESFYRTLVLSDYLKDEYKSSFIGGAMLFYERRNIMHETLGVHDGFFVRSITPELNLCDYKEVLLANHFCADRFKREAPRYSQGWWYCAFPVEMAEKKGLPLPFFLRADDVEWSWRAKQDETHMINMNGIFVWHADFRWKVSKVTDFYYLQRNCFFINCLYNENFKNEFSRHFRCTKKYLLETYDYASLALFKKALEDILRGSDALKENPLILCKTLSELAQGDIWETCTSTDDLKKAAVNRPRVMKWRKIVFNLTSKGLYSPKFLLRKQNSTLGWYPDPLIFRMVRSVKLYNPESNTVCVRQHNGKKLRVYNRQINNLIQQISQKFDVLCQNCHRDFAELTSLDFWKKYLHLTE